MGRKELRRFMEGPPCGYIKQDELRPPSNLIGQPSISCNSGDGGGACVSRNCGEPLFSHQPVATESASHIPQEQSHDPLRLPTSEYPSSLPLEVPRRSIYLWLSNEILQWKFIARRLGLQDSDIAIIESDHRLGGLKEHRLQMFLAWEKRFYQDCNYQRLGEVLMESDKNRHLYSEFVRRVKENEHLT